MWWLIACPDCPTALSARELFFENELGLLTAMMAAPVVAVLLVLRLASRWLSSGALFIGAGLGGFVDGIVLHQILQWHNMFSSKTAPIDLVAMKYNMIWDGIFHAATWLLTAVGVGLLLRAEARNVRRVCGGALAGWGIFNFVEGLVDHQLLGLHHVHPGAHELAFDLAFLASGLALVAIGTYVGRGLGRAAEPRC